MLGIARPSEEGRGAKRPSLATAPTPASSIMIGVARQSCQSHPESWRRLIDARLGGVDDVEANQPLFLDIGRAAAEGLEFC